ncbi:uncharacterized protein [Ptychodera flava]|uniref:uncharacterized protein n=1 Tax=Ptychodera flava TaxID=63121 RepID=UPI003969F267
MVHHGGILMKPPSFARNQKFCILHDLLICSKLPTYRYLLSMKLLSGDFYACPNYRSSLSQQPASENAGRFYGRQNLIAFETKLDAVSYMHDFQYIIKNEQKCQLFGQMKVKSVLILIVSTPEHSENRKLIRKTWARDNFVEDKNILFMFLVGDTRNELVKKDLSLENAQYGDIIQDSFEDTPGSDAIKTVSALKWAAKFCSKATFVVMTSDGIYLNVIRLVEYLRSSDTAEKSLLLGSLMKHDSHIEHDHNGIVQLSTHTYVMSSDVVHTLYLATMRTQLAGNTDVYFAELMKNLDILPRYHQAFSRRQFVKGLDQYLLNFHVTWEVRVPENMTSLHELRKPIDTFYDYNSDRVNEPGRYSFLIANPKRCRRGKQRKNVKVAIFVFSDCASDKWRQSARETWIRDLKTITDVGTVVNFVLGKCDVNEDDLIKTEFENFGDVIQGSFNDSGYYSNTLKTYLVLRWSSTYCFPSKFVIKLDQNVFLNVDSLINQLKSLGQQYNLFGSKITNEISPRNKDSLDFVPHSTWPYQYLPPYLAPDAYAMSADLVQDLYVGSYYAELVANEALFLGLVAHHIGASITDNDKFRTIERFNICEFSENFAVRTKTNTEFHTVHRFLKNEERCNGMKPMIKE